MGLIDELSHALVARYRKQIDPKVLSEAVRWFTAQTEPAKLEKLLLAFTEQFPNSDVFRGKITAAKWLEGTTDGMPNREAALEELLLLWIANINPAFKPFQQLFEDAGLKQQTVYSNVTAAFPDYFSTRPKFAPEIGTLVDALRAPFLASPDSLTGQLDYIRERWAPYLDADLRRILLAIDVLREEDLAIWMRFHPPGPDQFRHGAPTWGSMGFVGDEFIGYDEFQRRKYAHGYQAPLDEYENFSADQAWMPNVVLIAKSTYVWLEQLSKKYLRHIYRLDQIPDEELHLLAARGITGLWLIGLWERSIASQTIKRLRGHHDAVASAYSLKSYDIAQDLGGWEAYDNLKHRAAHAGLRLASDMVPNHMGIDSPWVIEHPDWFISIAGRARSPPTASTAPIFPPTAASRSRSKTITTTRPTPPSPSASANTPAARPATSTTATTAPPSPGTTPRSSTTPRPTCASTSSRPSCTSRASSPSSASTRRWCWPNAMFSAYGFPCPAPAAPSLRARKTPCRRRSSTPSCRTSSGARWSTASPPRSPARCCSPRPSGCSKATSSAPSACTASTTRPS
jgi:hypothetical protein